MRNEAAWQQSKFELRDGRLSVGPTASSASWLMTRLIARAYERHLPEHARGRLLDLGCGKSPLYAAYRPWVTEITCVDWTQDPLAAQHLDLELDLNAPLPLGSESYDTVVLSDVLEHIRSPESLLTEVARVLAPGGKLLLNVPFMYWLHEQPHDYYRYTEHGLRWLLERAGLDVLSLERLGGGVSVIADVAGKHLSRVPALGPPLVRGMQRFTWAVTEAPPIARWLEASARAFPLGYFVIAHKPSR